MQRKRRLKIPLCFFIIAILTPQFAATHSSSSNAVITQAPLSPHAWKDILSGGLWARLNNLESNTTILDSAQATAMFGSPPPVVSSLQLPTSKFTNNFRVTGNSSLFPLEDEPSIAVTNQTGHFLMVVGANSLSTGQMVSYLSKDQGAHWIGPSLLFLSRGNDSFASDPGLGVDRTGTFYYSFLSIRSSFFGSGGQDDVVVATSQDGGNWTNHVAVQRRAFNSSAPFNNFSELFDKPYISVGPNKSNLFADAIYVTYTDFVSSCSNIGFVCNQNSTIMQVHSTNGGVTWSKPVAVSPTVTFSQSAITGRLVQGSTPAVAPDGNLYVAYYDSGKDGWLNASASVMITRSIDGGKSFAPSTQAAMIPQQLTFRSPGNFLGFRWWSSMFPSMDVAPDGKVYIAYGAKQSKVSLDPADVYLVASIDGGVTWTQPRKINDDSTQNGQFFPWLKVSTDGVVHIIWGDQRLDPVGLGYDVFYAEATNHGTTISSNTRVTDVGTDPQVTIGFVGDYFNMAVYGNQVYPVWTDGRRGIMSLGREFLLGETDIYVARLGPRDIPSITIGSSAPAGYQAPTSISGSGLPRESYFVTRMNGIGLQSQKNGIVFFFSNKQGDLSDLIVPSSNYFGAYTVEVDEWVSGASLATATLYVVDTRSLQVLITGPSTASPGEKVTWNLQLVFPGGSLDQPGFSSTIQVTKALLTTPTGSTQDLTTSAVPSGTGSFSLSTTLPKDAAQGSYSLLVSASQTSSIVQSKGVGTATLVVSNAQSASSAPSTVFGISPLLFYTGAGGIIAAILIAILGTLVSLRQRGNKRETGKTEISNSPITSPT